MRPSRSAPRRRGSLVPVRLLLACLILVALVAAGFYIVRRGHGPGEAQLVPTVADHAATQAADNEVPVSGGTYMEGELGKPAGFSPLLATTQVERDLREVLFDGLTRVGGDGRAVPDLAEKWSVSDDGKTYTFTLRSDVRWHDGEPLTAQDVRFTVGLVQDPDFPGDPSLGRFWRGIVVENPDSATVVFHLQEAFAAFPTYLTLPIVPKHLLGGVLPRDLARAPFNNAPVGTGPFAFDSYDQGTGIVTLQANPNYFGDKPHLATLRFHFYSSVKDIEQALKSGEIQGSGSLPAPAILQPGAIGPGVSAYAPMMNGYTALFFNLRSPLFANADLRRALNLAVDRNALITAVMPNQAIAGSGPIPESSWAFARQPADHDVGEAQKLLANLGWSDSDGDGVLDNGGTTLNFPILVNSGDAQRVAVATELARQLAQLKVRVDVTPVPEASLEQSLANRQFTAVLYGWRSPTGDPDSFQLWDSSQADDGLNFSGLRSQTIDGLLEKARRTSDDATRADLYAQFQQAFAQQVPAIVLYYPRYFYVMNNKVHGAQASPLIDPSDRLSFVSGWFLTTRAGSSP